MAKVKFFDKVMGWRNKNRVAYDGLLADQESLNLGTLFDIQAQPEGTLGLSRFGTPVRLLNIEGHDSDSETITITLQNEAVFLAPTAMPVPGPVIGIVEFGTGSGYARVEFDIPSAVGGPAPNIAAGPLATANIFTPQKNNSITLVLPASSIRVFARNDAQTGFLIDFNGPQVNGDLASRGTPAQVRVHAAYGRANMVRDKVYREYMIAGPGSPFTDAGPSSTITIGIPAFAKRVYFPRSLLGTRALNVTIASYYSAATTGTIVLGVSDLSFIDLPPHASFLTIANPGPGSYANLSAVFELGF
jgi:hypothetical protein